MAKYKQVKEIIENIFSDGKPHEINEIKHFCEGKNIDLDPQKNVISNVLYRLKKSGYIDRTDKKGVYIKVKENTVNENEKVSLKDDLNSIDKLENQHLIQDFDLEQSNKIYEDIPDMDWNRYFVLKPKKTRLKELKLSITEKGEIKLNSVLLRNIQSRKLEIILSKDYKTIYLNPHGDNVHEFTKAGVAKNIEIVEILNKMNLSYPIVYKVEWDDKFGMWRGEIDIKESIERK